MSRAIAIGSGVFGAIWVVSAVLISIKATAGVTDSRLKSEYRGMAISLTFLGVFCMWLMWVSVYMHQLHPLINPILKEE